MLKCKQLNWTEDNLTKFIKIKDELAKSALALPTLDDTLALYTGASCHMFAFQYNRGATTSI